MKNRWEDSSSWSRDEKDRSVPKSMIFDTPVLSVRLHHLMYSDKDAWFVSCNDIGLVDYELGIVPIEEAQQKAINKVKSVLRVMYNSLPKENLNDNP